MSNHERGCKMAGSYTVRTCPVCGAKITPVRQWKNWGWLHESQVDEALRQRPAAGFDIDGHRLDEPW